jgi:hypothetical protein
MEISTIMDFWMSLVRSPQTTLEKEKGKGGLGDAFKTVLAMSLTISVLVALFIFALGSVSAKSDFGFAGAGIVSGLVFAVYFVGALLGFFIMSAIYFVIAKLLGGNGSFGEQTYLLSLVFTLGPLLAVISMVLVFIPCLGNILLLVISLYMIYLNAVAIQVAHGFSLLKAIVTVIVIPALIMLVIVVVLAMLLYVGLFNLSQSMSNMEMCTMPVGITCAKASLSSYTDKLDVTLVNGLQKTIVVTGIDCTAGLGGATPCNPESCPGFSGGGVTVDADESADFMTTCQKTDGTEDFGPGEVYAGKLNVEYYFKEEGSGAKRRMTGNIISKAS